MAVDPAGQRRSLQAALGKIKDRPGSLLCFYIDQAVSLAEDVVMRRFADLGFSGRGPGASFFEYHVNLEVWSQWIACDSEVSPNISNTPFSHATILVLTFLIRARSPFGTVCTVATKA